MDSNTKPKLTTAQLQELITAHFAMEIKEAVELTDGWANTAYRIRLEDDLQIVLKVAPVATTVMMRYEVQMMKTEVEALRQLRGVIPVPEVYAYDSSCRIIPSEYYMMEFLDGSPYNTLKSSLTEEKREAIELQLGRYNRLINELKGSSFGPCATPGSYGDDWPAVFSRMLMDVMKDAEDMKVSLPLTEADLYAVLEQAGPALSEVTEPSLVHWDLWDGNVFVQDGVITGIIDFERALWGDPLLEAYFRGMTLSPAFLKGYGLNGFTPTEEIRRLLYDLYLDLILVVECYFRQYNNPKHEKWAHDNLARGWEKVTRHLAGM